MNFQLRDLHLRGDDVDGDVPVEVLLGLFAVGRELLLRQAKLHLAAFVGQLLYSAIQDILFSYLDSYINTNLL